MSNSTLTG